MLHSGNDKTLLAELKKGRRISPMPFICDANGIIGFAGFSPPKEAPKEKPWWKFW